MWTFPSVCLSVCLSLSSNNWYEIVSLQPAKQFDVVLPVENDENLAGELYSSW